MTAQGRTSHRLTGAAGVPLALAAVLSGLLWLSGNSWFLLLAGAAVAVFIHGVTSRSRIKDLSISTTHAPRTSVGDELVSVLRVTNEGRRASSPVSLLMRTQGLAEVSVYVGSLRPAESATISTRCLALRRGISEQTRVDIVAHPTLGLVRSVLSRDIARHLTIHPRQREPRDRIPALGGAVDAGVDLLAVSGSELFGLREWRRGDYQRHVHWRSTARHRQLVVVERKEPALPALRLVLVGPSTTELFETMLAEAAAVCDRGLSLGRPVVASAWQPTGLALAPTGTRMELLDWWSSLTDVELPDPRSFGVTATAVFGSGELLVAGTPDEVGPWLKTANSSCAGLRLRYLVGRAHD